MLALAPASAQAGSITVNSNTDEVPIAGSNTNCSLREAVDEAQANNQNLYSDCTWTTPASGDDTINLGPGITTIAGGMSDEINNDAGDIDAFLGTGNSLTIDGTGSAATTKLDGGVNDRILEMAGTVGTLTLRDITLFNGKGTDGGALLMDNDTNLLMERAVVQDNESTSLSGGGLRLNNGTATINDSSFITNTANQTASPGGGAIKVTGGTLNLSRSVLQGNVTNSTLDDGSGIAGGGIGLESDATGSIVDSTIVANSVTINGAGVSDFPDGGGISADDSDLTVTGSTINGNTLPEGSVNRNGGGIAFADTVGTADKTLIVTNSTFSNNGAISAGMRGGAISMTGGIQRSPSRP